MKKYIYHGISAFCIGLVTVSLLSNLFVRDNYEVRIEKKLPPLTETLPLENGGEINIELSNGNKYVYMSFEDFEYISKKRSIVKKVYKSLEALFARLEG